jgi:hypothetical protein
MKPVILPGCYRGNPCCPRVDTRAPMWPRGSMDLGRKRARVRTFVRSRHRVYYSSSEVIAGHALVLSDIKDRHNV